MTIYIVQRGDTPFSIAQKYNISLQRLLSDNGLDEFSILAVGQALVIQFPEIEHIVKNGETISSIADIYSVDKNVIYRNNINLNGNDEIYPGQTLVIEYKNSKLKEEPIDINAYSYTYINDKLLKSTLPFLTYLTPFTYGINDDGSLIDLNDERLINMAKNFDVKSLMHLSTLNSQGVFSNETASIIFNDEPARNRLINDVIKTLKRKGYYGLDIDFEFINPNESIQYSELIDLLCNEINPLGYEIIAALAPKTSDEQKGQLYEGHNYALIGEAANYVLLMTYEWGYTYGPPLAVAPINKVREVLDYAVTRISPDRIFLGIPTYGYNWTLPYIKGVSRAPSISTPEALSLASRFGAEIHYDTISQSPWFNYTDDNGYEHEVWFEDARSIEEKLKLIDEYGFAGAGYWDLLRPFNQNWAVLNSLYNINNY